MDILIMPINHINIYKESFLMFNEYLGQVIQEWTK